MQSSDLDYASTDVKEKKTTCGWQLDIYLLHEVPNW